MQTYAPVSTSQVFAAGKVRGFNDVGRKADYELAGFRQTGAAYDARALPRFIRSVVSEAGLGRFVYLQGSSGRRYVFSSISAEQTSLYDRALFAATDPGSDSVHVGTSACDVHDAGSLLYVHLLDEDDNANPELVLADLAFNRC